MLIFIILRPQHLVKGRIATNAQVPRIRGITREHDPRARISGSTCFSSVAHSFANLTFLFSAASPTRRIPDKSQADVSRSQVPHLTQIRSRSLSDISHEYVFISKPSEISRVVLLHTDSLQPA
jgi:hypothetical protein